jgi:polyisoprenoid-binding protein YceI
MPRGVGRPFVPEVLSDSKSRSKFNQKSKEFTMKLVSRTLLTLSAAIAAVSPVASRAADTFTADPVHSSVVFHVRHLNTSTAWGRFDALAGSFTLDQSDPAKSRMTFTVKAASVDTNHKDRDNHLKSPDFFNAVQYPDITFASKNVAKSTGGYEVSGTLTFHGVTKPLSFVLVPTGTGKDMKGNAIAGVETSFILKQSDFGITKMAAAIGDEVTVFVSIEGIKK